MHEVDSWVAEKRSAYLYRVLSDTESGNPKQLLFLELAHEADEQAKLWVTEMRKTGVSTPEKYAPDKRTKLVVWLIQKLGPRHIRPVLAAMKIRGLSVYSGRRPREHQMPTSIEQVGASHKSSSASGGLRAAIFGVNDGLVSITLLVLGVAGASREYGIILLTGVAGLLAGAFSMAAGEYISMRSQREMFEYQISLERDELAQYPQEEAAELALIYQARGMESTEAKTLALRMIADPEMGLDTLAREELGINPEELGSPWLAALFSFFAFIVGGLVPLMPYLLSLQRHALLICVLMSTVGLFVVGATISLFTGRQALWGGFRMLGIGGLAGLVSYFIGHFVGGRIG
jgi:VIT1/CCC1 family predicted Fe2+/Mn2+ transporter